jgi:hypothetical protein
MVTSLTAAQAHPPASPTTSGVAGYRALHDIRDTIFAEPALAETWPLGRDRARYLAMGHDGWRHYRRA